jgi:hypothetical protein
MSELKQITDRITVIRDREYIGAKEPFRRKPAEGDHWAASYILGVADGWAKF